MYSVFCVSADNRNGYVFAVCDDEGNVLATYATEQEANRRLAQFLAGFDWY